MKPMVSTLARALPARVETGLDVSTAYEQHGPFMWATLYRLGVREADLPDALQDALVVVYRRGHTFDGSCRPTTWLFSVCAKIARAHRRRAHVRKEDLRPQPELVDESDPERSASQRAAERRLAELLDALPADRRVVLVMFEIEGYSCSEIAGELELPLGTVHSRLHKARTDFRAQLARRKARDQHQQDSAKWRGSR